jgi:hypothetical protein
MMVRIKEGIIITFASIVIPSFSFSTHACDNHGSMGFRDFGHMAQLGQTHPLMQRPSSAFRSAGLTLKHEKTIITPIAKTQRVDINYHLPTAYKNVYLRFTSGDNILLNANDNIRIDAINGVYTLDFVAKASGDGHILIWIDAIKGSLPYSKVQRIEVRAN